MMEIAKLIESEIGDFFAGFGHPGEPETPEEMQSQLLARVMPLLAGLEQEPVAQVYQPANIGICAPLGPSVMMLKPLSLGTKLYAAPQLPQPSVPDKAVFGEMPFLGSGERDYVRGWNDCRAAILQGAEPVERLGAEFEEVLAELIDSEMEPVSQPYTLRDGWVACSERLPDETNDPDGGATGYLVLYADGKEPNGGFKVGVWNVTYLRQWWMGFITHWMPLPAAPQQEVKP